MEINLFNNKVTDLIEAQLVAYKTNTLPVYSYFNLNQVHTKGLDIHLNWKHNKWDISSGYQLLYAFDNDIKRMFSQGEMYAKDLQTSTSFILNPDDYVGLFNRS